MQNHSTHNVILRVEQWHVLLVFSQFNEYVFSVITVNACTKKRTYFRRLFKICLVMLIAMSCNTHSNPFDRWALLPSACRCGDKNDVMPSDRVRICVTCNIKFFRPNNFVQFVPFACWFLFTI